LILITAFSLKDRIYLLPGGFRHFLFEQKNTSEAIIIVRRNHTFGKIDGDRLLLLIYSDTTSTPLLHQCLTRGSGLGKRDLPLTGIQRTTMHEIHGCGIEQAESDPAPLECGRNEHTGDTHRRWERLRLAK